MKRRAFLAGGAGLLTVGASPNANAELYCQPVAYGVNRCQAGLNSSVAPQRRQLESQWCWAACIEMVFAFHGYELDQETIVRDTWGAIYNLPAQPYHIVQNLNRSWVDRNGRRFRSSGDSFSANPMTAAQDLASDQPLIIGTGGHAMVLTALVYDVDGYGNGQVLEAIVRDPWPGRGRRSLSAQEWYGIMFAARIRVSRG